MSSINFCLKSNKLFYNICILKPLIILLLFLNLANAALCQDPTKADLSKIISSSNKIVTDLGIEKLYLQTDKSSYTIGDTMWFKAYVFDAAYLSATSKSGLLYVEIADDSNNVVKRIMLPVYGGRARGQIELSKKEIPEGNYILRAYTNWMRNFGENSYGQRDSVSFGIEVFDKSGKPVQGSFSLAVTDDGQVKTDSTSSSILTQLLLTSDLKGNVEDPGYYFHLPASTKTWQDLDQLLLTQGWVGYDWTETLKPVNTFNYPAEEEFLVKGRVTNMLNKPVAASGVTLFSKDPVLALDALTNEQGIFTFKGIVPSDTAAFFIQSRNKRNKSFNVGIEVDEFKPPVFTPAAERVIPWYVNVDTGRLALVNKQIQLQKQREAITGFHVLQEVIVKTKLVVKDSKNLNGPGEADIIIGEEELKKSGKATLFDLLKKRVKGFGMMTDKEHVRHWVVYSEKVQLIIDGTNTETFLPPATSVTDSQTALYNYYKEFFDYYDAEEIKGIEVMTSAMYQGRYFSGYRDPTDFAEAARNYAFIEVTTRGGIGQFLKKSAGTYLYRPVPFTTPKKFYSPKYNVESTPDMSDLRSTIFWAPDIVTDKGGKATVSFYTADNPGTYSLIIEGADMDGNIGSKRAGIRVKK